MRLCILITILLPSILAKAEPNNYDDSTSLMVPSSTCPPPGSIEPPCLCDTFEDRVLLQIYSKFMTQQTINTCLTTFRNFNSNGTNQIFEIKSFRVEGGDLESLDLSLLQGFKMDELILWSNTKLSTIWASNETPHVFQTKRLHVTASAMTEESLTELLKLVASETLEDLYLSHNPNIVRLGGGPFRSLISLKFLTIRYGKLTILDEDALLFADFLDPAAGHHVTIHMENNLLSNVNIHPTNGMPRSRGNDSFFVQLADNPFEFISADRFQKFLDSNVMNQMSFSFDQPLSEPTFECDERMQWLRDMKYEYGNRVRYLNCVNDLGHNIFDTSLLDPPNTITTPKTTTTRSTSTTDPNFGPNLRPEGHHIFALILCSLVFDQLVLSSNL